MLAPVGFNPLGLPGHLSLSLSPVNLKAPSDWLGGWLVAGNRGPAGCWLYSASTCGSDGRQGLLPANQGSERADQEGLPVGSHQPPLANGERTSVLYLYICDRKMICGSTGSFPFHIIAPKRHYRAVWIRYVLPKFTCTNGKPTRANAGRLIGFNGCT